MFEVLSDDPDIEYAMIVSVNRHGYGAKGGLKIKPLLTQKEGGEPKS